MQKLFILVLIFAIGSSAPVDDANPAESLFEIFTRLCVTMRPEHGNTTAQPEPFPVKIVQTPDLPSYTRGQSVLISLKGNQGFNFTGFLIQARAPGSTVPVGNWAPGAQGAVVGCGDPQQDFSGNDTATHQTGTTRNVQDLVWVAPDTPGQYRFELTTVERFGVYWMYQFTTFFNVV